MKELEKEILEEMKTVHKVPNGANETWLDFKDKGIFEEYSLYDAVSEAIQLTHSKIISIIDKRIENLKDTSKTEGLELSQISELNAINGVIQVLESLKKEVKQ